MTGEVVELAGLQLLKALRVGLARHTMQRRAGNHDAKVLSDGLGIDIVGAIGELALSLWAGLPWDGAIKGQNAWRTWRREGWDVSGLEVRTTRHRAGRLLLHPSDADNKIFVLATVDRLPAVTLDGWTVGAAGKQPGYWIDVGYKRPCYYVPRAQLRRMRELAPQIGRIPATPT